MFRGIFSRSNVFRMKKDIEINLISENRLSFRILILILRFEYHAEMLRELE